MKLLFDESNYKVFLQKAINGPGRRRGYQASLARAIGCQAAYLSQVVNGKAELTEDQAIKVAGFFELSPLASEYLLLLVRLSRSSSQELRDYLETQRLSLLRQSEEVQAYSDAKRQSFSEKFLQRYFASWMPSTIHVAVSSPNFQTPNTIAERLRISPKFVLEVLNFLEDGGLVEREGNRWTFKGHSIHFPREAGTNLVHQISRRSQAIRSLEENDKSDLHFSTMFTSDSKTFKILKTDLLDVIEKTQTKIHSSGTDDIFSICIDLFRVI